MFLEQINLRQRKSDALTAARRHQMQLIHDTAGVRKNIPRRDPKSNS
jgi:hypothetical protein